MNCHGQNEQTWQNTNCNGANLCHNHQQMMEDSPVNFSGNHCTQHTQQQQSECNQCVPFIDTPHCSECFENNCGNMMRNCVQEGTNSQEWNYVKEGENAPALLGCLGAGEECDIPLNLIKGNPGLVGDNYLYELKKRLGYGNERFDRWKTVYQETTDDLARNILKNNVDCRRKIIYPRRCIVCDSADEAIANERLAKILYPPKPLKFENVQYCTDYEKGDFNPVQPAPPMKCLTNENCFKPRPTYNTDLRQICNRKYKQ